MTRVIEMSEKCNLNNISHVDVILLIATNMIRVRLVTDYTHGAAHLPPTVPRGLLGHSCSTGYCVRNSMYKKCHAFPAQPRNVETTFPTLRSGPSWNTFVIRHFFQCLPFFFPFDVVSWGCPYFFVGFQVRFTYNNSSVAHLHALFIFSSVIFV